MKQFYKAIEPTLEPESPLSKQWTLESKAWRWLADGYGVVPEFNAISIKAIYVTGIVLNHCNCITLLLNNQQLPEATFFPAYGLFASIVELLGRCIRGNTGNYNNRLDLECGFRWLATPDSERYMDIDKTHPVLNTNGYVYTIDDLVSMRHFSAHGQASYSGASVNERVNSNKPFELLANGSAVKEFDFDVLRNASVLLSASMQSWLTTLALNPSFGLNLIQASITPCRGRPLFDALWPFNTTVDNYPKAVGDVIRGVDWSYKSRGYLRLV